MRKPTVTTLHSAANDDRATPPASTTPFIRHPEAERVLHALDVWLATVADGPAGAAGSRALVLAGEPRSGKTAVLREFVRQHPRQAVSGEVATVPVLMVEVPCSPGSKGLAHGVAEALGARLPASATVEGCLRLAAGLLARHGVRMLILDEAHHLFQGSDRPDEDPSAAWVLRLAGRDVGSVVFAGIGHWGGRRPGLGQTIRLHGLRSEDPAELASFVGAFDRFRGAHPVLDAGGALDDRTAAALHQHCGGFPGLLAGFLKEAADVAVETGGAGLTVDVLRATAERTRGTGEGWVNPFDPIVTGPGLASVTTGPGAGDEDPASGQPDRAA